MPAKPGDLHNGKLQALQVLNASGDPITKASQTPVNSADQVALHTYGSVFDTGWVTVHDTAVDGTAPFNANPAAKAAHATPFKRPENGLFRPGSKFRVLLRRDRRHERDQPRERLLRRLDRRVQADAVGSFGNTGKLSLFYKGDQAHAGFDNVAFLSRNEITFVEDAGDTLHGSATRSTRASSST